MANTLMSAKNGFGGGLIMDFAPDVANENTMTSALNATLITYNGNEGVLLNDMGNGRVETAFLPEGYIPVGSCEFGDIIYIVSYNPLINKSLIGCFPSPERNISSEELGGLGLSLSWKDFQEGISEPNGKLKASSVKKILYDNRDMTPGDKYIIYSEDLNKPHPDGEGKNNKYLSDYNNPTHKHGTFPKLAKIHVVSIEESGKIVYLDSTTKWYDNNDYYLNADLSVSGGIKDLDSYRTMVSSAYSIFSSKVSGKLALLIELEKITGFSCSWEPYINSSDSLDSEGLKYTDYSIYWNFNWTTDDYNINPNGAILTLSEWTGVDKNREGQYLTWTYNGKYEIDLLENSDWKSVTCPSSYETIISRNYQPEIHSIVSYSTFLSTYEYNNYQLRIINSIKQGDVEPYKLNILKLEGQPYVGHYYVNCTSIIEDVPKTTNSTGQLVNAWKGLLNDDIVNNYFHYPVIKKFADFKIPTKQIFKEGDNLVSKTPYISNLIYHYKIAPTMPYGILDEYTQEGYIDFSKIGTKSIALNTWKYYNYENTSTLTWGMEAYTEPGKGISEVVFEFYDNLGFVAAYHNKGKRSYNGTFTEYITLNESGSNYKLNNIKAFPDYDLINGKPVPKPTYHKGLEVLGSNTVAGVTYLDKNGNKVNPQNIDNNTTYYQDDSGTLYSNFLYLVKIIIKYCNKGILDEYTEPSGENDSEHVFVDYRWFWTNTMFNEYYYNALDFKDLQFTLNLDCQALFETIPENWKIEKVNYIAKDNYDKAINIENPWDSLSAVVQFINQEKDESNLKMAIRTGLLDTYNTFNIDYDGLELMDAIIYTAQLYIENFPELPKVIFTEEDDKIFNGIYPVHSKNLTGVVDSTTSKTLNELVKSNVEGKGLELYGGENNYENYVNNYLLTFSSNVNNKELLYITSKDKELSKNELYPCQEINVSKISYNENTKSIDPNNSILLKFKGIHYSKYYYYNTLDTTLVKVLRSFALNIQDLEKYALTSYDGINIKYNKMYLCAARDENGAKNRYVASIVTFDLSNKLIDEDTFIKEIASENYPILEGLNLTQDKILEHFKFLFPLGFGHNYLDGNSCEATIEGKFVSSNKRIIEGSTYSNRDLGGTLAGITNNGNILPGNHMLPSSNALTKHVPAVLGYLTLLFYLLEAAENNNLYYPYNYAFLEDNYSLYTRDIVINIKTTENILNNSLFLNINKELIPSYIINISGIKYYDYIDTVLRKEFSDEDIINEKKKDCNVCLILKDCLKTFPLQVRFNYDKSIIVNPSSYNRVIIKSPFKEIESYSFLQFSSGELYYYDFNNKEFSNIRNANNIKLIDKYHILDGRLVINNEENTRYISLKNIKNYLTLDIDALTWKSFPISDTKTYSVKTSRAAGADSSRHLSGFKTGLKFY